MQSGRAVFFPDDALLRSSAIWFAPRSGGGVSGDVHLCATVDLLRVVRRFSDLFANSGTDEGGLNFDAMVRVYDEAVSSAVDEWHQRIQRVAGKGMVSASALRVEIETCLDPLFAFRTHQFSL